jgi:hypothetical protein
MTLRPTVIVCTVMAAASFAIGRASKRRETVTVDKVVYQDREKVVTRDVVKEVKVAEIQVQTKWKTRTVTEPGGTITVYQEVERGTDTKTATNKDATRDQAKEREVQQLSDRTVTVHVPVSNWQIQASPGVSWERKLYLSGALVKPGLLGPLGAGLWAGKMGGEWAGGVTITGTLP